ncbi:MAG: DUF368 domain-containing protein [Rikenellaceae bacterium]
MKSRGFKEYLGLALRGVAMGAADVVPGVSGGTIALITGIYEELIESIKSINIESLKLLLTFKVKEFSRAINGAFLVSVLCGIAISVLSLARVVTYLLEHEPILLWSLFFGLILASVVSVVRRVNSWNVVGFISFIVGVGVAYYITIATPATTPDGGAFIFLCGAVAICAMILPGISGSFILLLMGKYHYIMDAIKSFDIGVIATFGAGAAVGIVLFSNLLSWLLNRYHDITIALLAGFMLGSLGKVYPWKESYLDNGVEMTRNILSTEQLAPAIVAMLIGAAFVILIERVSSKHA